MILFFLIISCNYFLLAQDCNAKLSVQTDIEDASLFIDDIFISEGNNFQVELELGFHSIRMVEGFRNWNAKIIADTIIVNDCDEIYLDFKFRSEKLLDTNPQDVYVFEDDSLIGFTPVWLEAGFKELKLEKPDYLSVSITPQEISSGEKPELLFIGEPKSVNFYGSTLFKVLIGTALAFGATTAYFKLQADQQFDEYIITGNPELLDQVNHYDVVSGVTFVALQINFGLIIYLFLSE